jgi:hypothetical protein
MLDLFRSPEADPLYRTKLMVVGYENVGKTTILDCLFPFEGWLESQGGLLKKKTRYWFKLQGRCLSKYDKQGDTVPHKNKVVILENRQWEVISLLQESKGQYGIKLTPNKKMVKGEDEIEVYCPDKESHDMWMTRLKRICMNNATHGIEIQSMEINNEITQDYFKEKEKEGNKGKLTMSVWDFAGQHDYYNNHHYFLSSRSIFLVMWKMNEGVEKGLKGLEFWFRSLSTHLFFTFIFTLENIDQVQEVIFRVALGHSYMGERVPQSYVRIGGYLKRLREERKDLPIIQIDELNKDVNNLELVKRALGLLSLWGECVYFDSPPELASWILVSWQKLFLLTCSPQIHRPKP